MTEASNKTRSPIDIFLEKNESNITASGAVKIVHIKRDESKNYVVIDSEYSSYKNRLEVFVARNGERIASRHWHYNNPQSKGFPNPHVGIVYAGEITTSIYQMPSSPPHEWGEEGRKASYLFQLYEFGFSPDYTAIIEVEYCADGSRDHGIVQQYYWFWKDPEKWLIEPGKTSGLLEANYFPESESWRDHRRDDLLISDTEVLSPDTKAIHGVESHDGSFTFINRLVHLPISALVTFPKRINIEEWDRKVTSPDESWKDLRTEFPVRVSLSSTRGE